MTDMLPLFLNLEGRVVVLVGAGPVAAAKLRQLTATGARVRVIAPDVCEEIAVMTLGPRSLPRRIDVLRRPFAPGDLDDAWLVVAAATPEVNRQVAQAAETRRLFVNAVDDPANASAFLSGVVRRAGVTVAVSTSGEAPALTALLREGLEAVLPQDLQAWIDLARSERIGWRREGVPMGDRKPRLLRAINDLYRKKATEHATSPAMARSPARARAVPTVPWLNGPEDSWL